MYGRRPLLSCYYWVFKQSLRHDSPGNRYTFAHELGHIFGARHDNDPLNFPFRYGHGYSLPNGGSRTVMARAGTVGRIPYWSNPDITYNNEPLGTELGNDVARVHREVEHDIASFRDPMSITSISGPTTLEVNEQGIWSPEVCVGSSTGTTTYQWKYRVKGDLSWSSGGTSGTYSRSMGSNDCIILVQCKVCIGSDCDVALTAVDCENCTCSPAAYNDKNKNDGSRTTTSDESNSQDKGLQLICHGANPVSGKLQFQFTLPHSSPIKIQFYDSFGRLVSRLSDKLYELGTHNLSVDVSTWAPSVYICTLETNYKVATEYFTIIR